MRTSTIVAALFIVVALFAKHSLDEKAETYQEGMAVIETMNMN